MSIKSFTIDGKTITFQNSYRKSPSGFMHETILYIDNWEAMAAECYYINRTWERYRFQSVMLEAVHKLQKEETARLKREYKKIIGCKNLMSRHMPGFLEYVDKNECISFYKKIEEAIR